MSPLVQAGVFLELLKCTIFIFSDVEIKKCSSTVTMCKCRSLLLTATISPLNLNRFMLLDYKYKYLAPVCIFRLKIRFSQKKDLESTTVTYLKNIAFNPTPCFHKPSARSITTEKLNNYITGLIPQILQLQAQGTLASLRLTSQVREVVCP